MAKKPNADRSTRDTRSGKRALVIGSRRGLHAALEMMGVPYVLWTDRPAPRTAAERVHQAPISGGEATARRETERLAKDGPFTHVIAANEASVLPAAVARRVLGARQSSKTTLIRCHDKLRMKQHLSDRGIPMTPFLDATVGLEPAEIMRQLGAPLVVKPRRSSGGRGQEFVVDAQQLQERPRRGYLFERYVDAREASVESFVSGGEILFQSVTEYWRKGHVNVVPAGLDEQTREDVLALNRRVLTALNVTWGMTHVEVYLTDRGPLFGEIALRPPGGYIMDLLRLVWGVDSWRAFAAVELEVPFEFPIEFPNGNVPCLAHAAAIVVHPGAGTVVRVAGVDDVRRHPATVRIHLRIHPGDEVHRRVGVGHDVGYVLLRAPTRAALQQAISFVDEHLRIDIGEPR